MEPVEPQQESTEPQQKEELIELQHEVDAIHS
jgi:hypothetical protein